MSKIVDFDAWDDFVSIRIFGKTYKVRQSTFRDAKKVAAVQEELEQMKDEDRADKLIDFIYERFSETDPDFPKEKLLDVPPAKLIALMRVITQGPEEADRPLPVLEEKNVKA